MVTRQLYHLALYDSYMAFVLKTRHRVGGSRKRSGFPCECSQQGKMGIRAAHSEHPSLPKFYLYPKPTDAPERNQNTPGTESMILLNHTREPHRMMKERMGRSTADARLCVKTSLVLF